MPIRIRRASPADEAAIDQWQRSMENLDDYLQVPDTAPREPEAVRKRFSEWLRLPREQKVPHGWERIDLVAVEDFGAICGYAAVMFGPGDPRTDQPEAYVSEMHVWPQYRNRGVAKGLLDMAEAYALQRGVPYLSITVAAGHTGMNNLLQSTGYRPETIKHTKKVARSEEG